MARKRFTADERALLTGGASVEWLFGSRWLPATVVGPVECIDGYDRCMLTNQGQTQRASVGQTVMGSPGHVRASTYVPPAERAATPATGGEAGLCADCQTAADKWIHINPTTARGIALSTGKPAIHTIRDQVRIIRETCQARHRVTAGQLSTEGSSAV